MKQTLGKAGDWRDYFISVTLSASEHPRQFNSQFFLSLAAIISEIFFFFFYFNTLQHTRWLLPQNQQTQHKKRIIAHLGLTNAACLMHSWQVIVGIISIPKLVCRASSSAPLVDTFHSQRFFPPQQSSELVLSKKICRQNHNIIRGVRSQVGPENMNILVIKAWLYCDRQALTLIHKLREGQGDLVTEVFEILGWYRWKEDVS